MDQESSALIIGGRAITLWLTEVFGKSKCDFSRFFCGDGERFGGEVRVGNGGDEWGMRVSV